MPLLVKKKKQVKYAGSYCDMRQKNRKDHRLNFLFIIFLLFALVIVARLYKLQVLDHGYYVALASGQHEIFKQLYPVRGTIYFSDKEGSLISDGSGIYPVAMNRKLNLLYAVPKDVSDPDAVLQAMKEVFELDNLNEDEKYLIKIKDGEIFDEENILTEEEIEFLQQRQEEQAEINDWHLKLSKQDDPYEPLKHFVTDDQMEDLNSFGLEGIYFVKEITRYYPEKNLAGQLLGFVGKHSEDNMLKGSYGIEGCYDQQLAGEAGFLRSEKDTGGRWIAVGSKDFREASDGQDIVLTIDKSIEFFVCNELKKGVEKYAAERGSVIVMDPQTGKILALCNYPDFDPNEYNEVEDISIFNNHVISDNYECGSVFKPITMAAAIDAGAIDPFTGYQDPGEMKIDDFTIKNSDLQSHGWQTMTQVLEKSLNTGTIFAARKLGLEKFRSYVQAFGFGQKTGIEMCYEPAGDISSLDKTSEIYMATASYGQGITVTPIQLAQAFSAIANEGKIVQPYILEKIISADGEIVKSNEPKIIGQAISPQTAKQVSGMLVSVVKNGHATNAAVPGYLVAGKTGTAQVPDFEKGGYSDKTIHTFAGFAPFEKPRFVAVIKLDHVQNVGFAADSTAPIFSRIAKFILDYYNVPVEE